MFAFKVEFTCTECRGNSLGWLPGDGTCWCGNDPHYTVRIEADSEEQVMEEAKKYHAGGFYPSGVWPA
jgi:hypothetical protein